MRKLTGILLFFIFMAACGTKSGDDDFDSGINRDKPLPPRPAVMDLSVLKYKPYEEIFNDSNYLQYMSAERLGIDPIHTPGDAYNTRRPIVRIESGANYIIPTLTHSVPFLVPEAADLLDEIGRDFKNALAAKGDRSDDKFFVTSVLRTAYTVRKLRKVNVNAVDSSTHMFATTFDIGYNNFHIPDSARSLRPGALKETLAEVLLRKRNEGKCFVKYEKHSPCFHITVYSE